MDPDATIIASSSGSKAELRPSPSAAPPVAKAYQPVDGDLPPGYRLEQFEVHERLGRGGFSVVYKVFDHRLEQFRALKEYFPRGFAVRAEGLRVEPRSRRDEEVFNMGLSHFVSESKHLARFNHPSLVHVYQTIEANGTAYMVMHLAQGETLEDVVAAMPAPPDEAWLLKVLDPLTAALTVVHDAGVVHRDIKPENVVLLQGSQRPVLLDFGAARQVIDRSGQPTGILTPGYAPIEQYPDSGLQQGPWTDIYALAASVHRLIAGKAPPNAMARQMRDSYAPLAKALAGRYSDRLLKTLDACLVIDPTKRPRSIEELRNRLGLQAGAFDRVSTSVVAGSGGANPAVRSPMAWAIAGAAGLMVVGAVAFIAISKSGTQSAKPPVQPPVVSGPGADPPAPTPAASAPPIVVAASDPVMAMPSAPAPAAALPTEPGAAFDHIVAGASPEFGVRLEIEKPRLVVGKTAFRLRLNSTRSGHFYVLIHDTDREVRVLYPDAWHPEARIAAGKTLHWPPQGEDRPFGEPVGAARILVVVSELPLDLDTATKNRDQDWRVLFQGSEAAAAAAAQPAGRHLYLGRPNCRGGSACEAPYGAASAAIEVVK